MHLLFPIEKLVTANVLEGRGEYSHRTPRDVVVHVEESKRDDRFLRERPASICTMRSATFPVSGASARFLPDRFQMPPNTSHTARASTPKPTSPTRRRANSPDNAHGSNPTASYSESDQNLLAMLNSTVACLKEKQMDVEALGCLEQSLWLKRRMFGLESPAVQKALHEVVLSYNSIAMQFLALGQFDQCLSMLRKAEAITAPPGNFKNCQSLQILTYNNIGCCYRKLGKLKSALKYLKEAAEIGAGCAHVKNLSITHLNLCAIHSQLGRHDLALEHAQAAIFHTQEELVGLDSGVDTNSERSGDDVLDAKSREEKIVSLAVAYHNLAVELEFNGRGEASLQWYKKALQLVARFKESNQALYESFEKIFQDAKRKYQDKQMPRQPTAASVPRPKSAHPSSARTAVRTPSGPRDVSYSSTVASQCYKPTKPSTPGLQYTRAVSPPARSTGSRTRIEQPQRPSSATASRRRPLSASSAATRQESAGGISRRNSRDVAICESVEERWQQIERELFGSSQDAKHDDLAYPRQGRRPQSARYLHSSSQQPRSPQYGRAPTVTAEEQFDQDDNECGIVQDDGDDDELDDQLQGACRKQIQRSGSARCATQTSDAGKTCPSKERPPCVNARRRLEQEEPRRVPSTRRFRDVESDHVSSRHAGGNHDDSAELSDESSTAAELPRQRVSHMEYLRRMKKLSDSIQEDLLGGRTTASRTSLPPQPRGSKQAETNRRVPPAACDTPPPATEAPKKVDESVSPVTTPRSTSSKLRERLELVRRESVKSLGKETEDGDGTECSGLKHLLLVEEDAQVFDSEIERCAVEQRLLHEAAARRIQSAARRDVALRRVRILRQHKQREEAAKWGQKLAKEAAIEAREQELQALREAKQAQRQHEAAMLIQATYRRIFHPDDESNQETRRDQGRDDADEYTPPTTARSAASRRETELSTAPSAQTTGRSSDDDLQQEPPRCLTPSATASNLSSRDSFSSPHDFDLIVQHAAALTIQCSFRSYRASCRVAARRARRLSRSYIERNHWSLVLSQAESKELAFLEEQSAIKIQALARGCQARFLVEAVRIGQHAAASSIQSGFRHHQHRVRQAETRGVRSLAARNIQRVYREYAGRRARQQQLEMREEALEVHHIAAQTIQRRWRAWCEARDNAVEEWEAATCIQALGRGYQARKSYQSLRASASHVSAFSIDNDVVGGGSWSRERISDEPDDYEDLFEDDEGGEKPLCAAGRGNLSFLPQGIHDLFVRYHRHPPDISPLQRTKLSIEDDTLRPDHGFEELLQAFESSLDVESTCRLLDEITRLIETHPERFRTLPVLIRIAHVLELRIDDGELWPPDVEKRAATFVLLFRDLLVE